MTARRALLATLVVAVSFATTCDKGKWLDNSDTCSICGMGTFQDEDEHQQRECKTCEPGRYQDSGKTATNRESCPKGDACAVGKYLNRIVKDGDVWTPICEGCTPGRYTDEVGQTVCKYDPNQVGVTLFEITAYEYRACMPGRYGDVGAKSAAEAVCHECPAGRYQPEAGRNKCKGQICQSGRYGERGQKTSLSVPCFTCPAGKWTSQDGLAECSGISCPQGKFSDMASRLRGARKADEAACYPCAPGRFQDEVGQSTCKIPVEQQCQKGEFGRIGATALEDATCSTCPAGMFSNLVQMTHGGSESEQFPLNVSFDAQTDRTTVFAKIYVSPCRPCELGKFSIAHEESCSVLCPKNYGAFDADVERENEALLANVSASGAGSNSSTGLEQVVELVQPTACVACPAGKYYSDISQLGGNADAGACLKCAPTWLCEGATLCKTGYQGYLCMKCIKGYRIVEGNLCEKCGTLTTATVIVAVLVVLFSWRMVLLLWRALQRAKTNRVKYFGWLTTLQKISLVVSYMQVSGIVISLPLEWPKFIVEFWRYLGSFITFDLFKLTTAECAISSFYIRWLLSLFIPLFFMSPFLIMVFFHSPLLFDDSEAGEGSVRDLRKAKTNKRGDEMYQTLAIVTIFMYALMVSKSVEVFECRLGPDHRWYMRSDTSIRCWEDDLGHTVSCIFAVMILYIYGGWLPYKLRRAVYKLGELKFDPYHKNFEFVLLGQKLVLVMIQRFLYFSWEAQVGANIIVNGGLLYKHIELYRKERAEQRMMCVATDTKMPCITKTSAPYYDHNLNVLSANIFLCELAFVVVGTVCRMHLLDDALATYILLGLFGLVILYFVVIFRRPPCDFSVLEGRYAGYRSALEENARDLAGIAVGDSKNASVNDVEAMELQQAAMLSSRSFTMSSRQGASTRLDSFREPSQRTPDARGGLARSSSPVVWGDESPTQQNVQENDEQDYIAYLASLKSAANEQKNDDGWDDDNDELSTEDDEHDAESGGDYHTDDEEDVTKDGASSAERPAERPSFKAAAQLATAATRMKLWV